MIDYNFITYMKSALNNFIFLTTSENINYRDFIHFIKYISLLMSKNNTSITTHNMLSVENCTSQVLYFEFLNSFWLDKKNYRKLVEKLQYSLKL